jgi:hypothetical protein
MESPGRNAREKTLEQIWRYYHSIKNSNEWRKNEKNELLRFLAMQIDSWGMLQDDLKSPRVRRTKERILLRTWGKFTEGMVSERKRNRPSKREKGLEEGLKRGLSTSETVVYETALKEDDLEEDGIETPLGETVDENASEEEVKPAEQTKLTQ